jgi:hypothetical protein
MRLLQYNAAVQLLATFNPTEIGALVRGFREISKTSQRWHVGRLSVFSLGITFTYLKQILKAEFRILKCRNPHCLLDPDPELGSLKRQKFNKYIFCNFGPS